MERLNAAEESAADGAQAPREHRARRPLARLDRPLAEAAGGIVAESPAMRRALELIERAARSRANVLITGESGTGKELAARALHERSDRVGAPFLAQSCTAVPEAVLEAELFGRAGSEESEASAGLFLRAHGGTLFLDDVGELTPGLQARLLRTLVDREVRPAGSERALPVDVRVLSATSHSLDAAMQAGRFREDLYYRLDVIHLHLPPLRERSEDLPLLVDLFARRSDPRRVRRFTAEALRELQRWSWPGNVRELQNWVERVLVLSDAPFIGPAELRLGVAPLPERETAGPALEGGLAEAARTGVTMRELQDRYIEQMIAFTGGRKVEAAQRLGIDRKTLYRRRMRSAD